MTSNTHDKNVNGLYDKNAKGLYGACAPAKPRLDAGLDQLLELLQGEPGAGRAGATVVSKARGCNGCQQRTIWGGSASARLSVVSSAAQRTIPDARSSVGARCGSELHAVVTKRNKVKLLQSEQDFVSK